MAPRALRAVELELRERTEGERLLAAVGTALLLLLLLLLVLVLVLVLVATPLTSFSCSWMGSRLTNSFWSNWTTTYGAAWTERTRRPRAWISLTCSWPRAARAGAVVEGEETEPDEPDEWAVGVCVDGGWAWS